MLRLVFPQKSINITKVLLTIGLIGLFFSLRLLAIYVDSIPFMYDHARDALAVLEMLVNRSPTLIGPSASIPGLFFGPLWYYLLLPFYALNLNPLISVIPVLLIATITFALMWRYMGWMAAVIVATTTTWIWTATSAWNPFPMTLVSTCFLLILTNIVKNNHGSNKRAVVPYLLLGLSIGAGFHFSSAYALFYLPIMIVMLWLKKVRPSLMQSLVFLLSLGVLFLPQLIFELRNNWLQTRSILEYFQSGNSTTLSFEKVLSMVKDFWGYLITGVLPDLTWMPNPLQMILLSLLLLIFIRILWIHKTSVKKNDQLVIAILMIALPLLGYVFLHFSPWYVIGMLPAMTVLFSFVWMKLSKFHQCGVASLYIVASIISLSIDLSALSAQKGPALHTLRAKMAAIELVRTTASNRTFSSYQYVPDVYDYPYQYLYLADGLQGKNLPTEFAYAPNPPTYVTGKNEMLSQVGQLHPETVVTQKPEIVFFIVEKPEYPELLDAWWHRQIPFEKQGERIISDGLTVIWGIPLTPEK